MSHPPIVSLVILYHRGMLRYVGRHALAEDLDRLLALAQRELSDDGRWVRLVYGGNDEIMVRLTDERLDELLAAADAASMRVMTGAA
ncbi:hypothetical protein MF672_010965 [Actinomadura sp. ATCC 31491]|uniref:Uncharacterized protein n=1 Tax=Actinomadura luzonensis TaxID=2805427 RepID=A0ABT0FQ90_9ACTN|nr:hypothetical protein [Actinomadura luzonensis]MCK2214308.1 hypothetical protein [Actinomadura luzonensis]